MSAQTNFREALKVLKGDAILNMVEDESCHQCFILDVTVSNDDRKMIAVIKHLSRGAQCQVLKSPK